jgi:DNA-directed RNA polymerase specialized sigma subunit
MKKRRIISKSKKFTRDSLNEVDNNADLDHKEILMDPESIEAVANQTTAWHKLIKEDPANDYNEIESRMAQEAKIKKIFQTASQVLTEIQFKIFVMRYAYDLKQKDISKQLKCNQSYVPAVLKASVKKIQARLKNEGVL